MRRIIAFISFVLAFSGLFELHSSQPLRFDCTIHDFGPVLISDGAQKFVFTAKNVSKSNVVIRSVTTSCGCTSATWPHEAIAPGQTVRITAKYTNDEGPYPFDKTLTVKLVDSSTPIILHLRGISMEKKKSDKEIFTWVHGGLVGFQSDEFKTRNIEMGRQQTDQAMLSNLSQKPVKISFSSVSDGLSLEVRPNPVPAGSRAILYYTVTSRQGVWGRNEYRAVMNLNGSPSSKAISVSAFTAMNSSSFTKEQKAQGSKPVFRESTFSFGHRRQGSRLKCTFNCENAGKSKLVVYKTDSDFAGAVPGTFPDTAPGGSSSFTVSLDTSKMPKGEALVILTLTTNSPARPIVNLFLAGWID